MPRAKKTTTKTDKKVVAKKQTVQDIEKIIKKQVQEQLEEALLNIEIESPEPVKTDAWVDMDLLREEIKKEVQFAQRKVEHVQKIENKSDISISRSELKLVGEKEFLFTSDLDGLVISENDKALITASKSGAIGFGLKAPRSFGVGSAHFRANYTSDAPMPTSGDGSTRGVIVEGDGDDDKTFTFRVLSRMNRQGLNVTGDGSLLVNSPKDETLSRVTINQTNNDRPALNVISASKYFDETVLNLQAKAGLESKFNFINAKADVDNNKGSGIDVFKVNAEGSVYSEQSFYSNGKGYAELFEWADGNHKNENRDGFTVALNEKGQLIIADEGDSIIGVVGSNPAFIGNAGWNGVQDRYNLNADKEHMKTKYKIVEWLDDTGVLHSYDVKDLDQDFAFPENAIIYETDSQGNDMIKRIYRSDFDKSEEYTDRINNGWSPVIIAGTTPVYKGQFMGSNWIKVSDISDDLEQWIIK
jgi:hypothetical protein